MTQLFRVDPWKIPKNLAHLKLPNHKPELNSQANSGVAHKLKSFFNMDENGFYTFTIYKINIKNDCVQCNISNSISYCQQIYPKNSDYMLFNKV